MWPEAEGQRCRNRWNVCRRKGTLGKLGQQEMRSRANDAKPAADEGDPLALCSAVRSCLAQFPVEGGEVAVVYASERERRFHSAQSCDRDQFRRILEARGRLQRIIPFSGKVKNGFASNGLDWYTAYVALNASIQPPFAGARADGAARRSAISVSVPPHTRDTEASEALRLRRRPR